MWCVDALVLGSLASELIYFDNSSFTSFSCRAAVFFPMVSVGLTSPQVEMREGRDFSIISYRPSKGLPFLKQLLVNTAVLGQY